MNEQANIKLDKQTDGQKDGQTKHTDRHTYKCTNKKIYRKKDKEKTDKHANDLTNIKKMDKFINRHTYRWTNKHKDGQTDRQKWRWKQKMKINRKQKQKIVLMDKLTDRQTDWFERFCNSFDRFIFTPTFVFTRRPEKRNFLIKSFLAAVAVVVVVVHVDGRCLFDLAKHGANALNFFTAVICQC